MESNINSLIYCNLEAIASILLLESDHLDDNTLSEMKNFKEILKDSEEHFDFMKSSAFRLNQDNKDLMLKAKAGRKYNFKNKNSSCTSQENKRKKYGYWLTASRTPLYAESIIPDMPLSDYKLHFGLSPSQIEKLTKLIEPYYVQSDKQKNLESFVLVGLSVLATQKSYREIGMQMSRGKGHVCIWSQKFNAILSEHFTHLIKWPEEHAENVESSFKSICGFPGVIGAFGACHIPLKYASKLSDSCYRNNKGFYSLVLSATCDHQMRFTSLSLDTPSNFQSTNGMSSKIIQALMTNSHSWLQNNSHILAGYGYPICNQILTPYLMNDESLTEKQSLYNNKLERTRRVILQCFNLLRKRFQRFNVIDMIDFNRAKMAILSACILHNFVMEDEDFDEPLENISYEIDEVLDVDAIDDPPCLKRDQIANNFENS